MVFSRINNREEIEVSSKCMRTCRFLEPHLNLLLSVRGAGSLFKYQRCDQSSSSGMHLSQRSGMIQFVIYQHTFLFFLSCSRHLWLIFQEKTCISPTQLNRKHLLYCEMWLARIWCRAGEAIVRIQRCEQIHS